MKYVTYLAKRSFAICYVIKYVPLHIIIICILYRIWLFRLSLSFLKQNKIKRHHVLINLHIFFQTHKLWPRDFPTNISFFLWMILYRMYSEILSRILFSEHCLCLTSVISQMKCFWLWNCGLLSCIRFQWYIVSCTGEAIQSVFRQTFMRCIMAKQFWANHHSIIQCLATSLPISLAMAEYQTIGDLISTYAFCTKIHVGITDGRALSPNPAEQICMAGEVKCV